MRLRHLLLLPASPAVFVATAALLAGPADTLRHAQDLVEMERYAAAQPLIEVLARERPGAPEVEYLIGRERFELDDFKGAELHLTRAIAKDASRAAYHEWLGNTYGRWAQRAGIFRRLGLAKHAKAEWETALRLDPKSVDVRRWLIEFHVQAPGIAGGDPKEAVRLANEIVRLDPYWGALAWARVHAEAHDEGERERDLRRAVALGPNRREAHLEFARVLLQAHRPAEAEAEARAAIAAEPDNPEGVEVLVAAEEQQRRYAEALTAVDAAETRARDEVDRERYQLLRARVLVESGQRLDEAERVYRAYLTRPQRPGMPALAAIHRELGQLYDRQGQRQKAEEEWRAARRLRP